MVVLINLRGLFTRFGALPGPTKALVVVAVLLASAIALRLAAILSPFLVVLTLVVLAVSILGLMNQAYMRAPAGRWGTAVITSLVLLIVFPALPWLFTVEIRKGR